MILTTKLFKQNNTPVSVRFGLAFQLVLLNIKDWKLDPIDIRPAHLKTVLSEVYELPIDHGISCDSCAKIVSESYTHPTLVESRREKRPGRPLTRARDLKAERIGGE
jgi:hypothetical protein